MNKDTFIKLINNPSSISSEELSSLDDVLKSFPFCNAASILVAKGNFDRGSMFSNQKVKRAALFAPSREVLRKLIQYQDDSENESHSTSTEAGDVPLSGSTSQDVPENLSSIEEIYQQLSTLKNHIAEEKYTQDKDLVAVDFDTKSGNETFNALLSEKKTSIESEIIAQPLKFYVHSKEFGKDIRKAQVDLISEYLSFRSTKVVEAPDFETQIQIIQKFIEEAPQLSKPASLPSAIPNVDLSKKSTTEDFELVTENIANILVKQEKYKKATEVYEKLILKYPDKSTYFAGKIAIVKSLIK